MLSFKFKAVFRFQDIPSNSNSSASVLSSSSCDDSLAFSLNHLEMLPHCTASIFSQHHPFRLSSTKQRAALRAPSKDGKHGRLLAIQTDTGSLLRPPPASHRTKAFETRRSRGDYFALFGGDIGQNYQRRSSKSPASCARIVEGENCGLI